MHLARGVLTVTLVFPLVDQVQRVSRIQRWSVHLLSILAIRVEVSGAPPQSGAVPVMMVANHVSWLDIYVINAVRAARFVAKSEIRDWPLLGWFSEKAGTLFIERARWRHIVTVNAQLAAGLRQGDTFAVFLEATTSAGNVVMPFHGSLLQPVIECGVPLHPVAIRYSRADGSLCGEADYQGDKSLFGTLLLMISQPVICARLHFLPPPESAGKHRRELAREATQLIALRLGVPVINGMHPLAKLSLPC